MMTDLPKLDLKRFYQACNPSKTLVMGKAEDRQYYIDFSQVRGVQVIKKLKRTILLTPEDSTCQLFTGHIGCGKSTELLRLKNELENNPYPVLTASELSQRIQVAVSNNVEQEPQMGVLQGAGDELGEFLFIKMDVNVSGIAKDKVKVKVNVISDTDGSTSSVDNSATDPALTPEQSVAEKHKPKKEDIVLPVQSF